MALARRLRPVSKVVLMGMGEPAHNLDPALEAIELLGTAGGIGHKAIVFSTMGDARVFERLPLGRVKPALALSLHTTKPGLRERLLPRAAGIAPQELVRRALDYADATGYPLQLQWTLIEGVNDGDDEVDRLAQWLAGRYAVLNLIPFNAIDGAPFRRPAWERSAVVISAMADIRTTGCDILTLGQYLQPTKEHLPVDRYVHPDEFRMLKDRGLEMGFRHVESGPLVRSSYHAEGHVGR